MMKSLVRIILTAVFIFLGYKLVDLLWGRQMAPNLLSNLILVVLMVIVVIISLLISDWIMNKLKVDR